MLGFLFSKYSEIEKYLLIQLFVPLKIFPTNFPICFRMYAFEKKNSFQCFIDCLRLARVMKSE